MAINQRNVHLNLGNTGVASNQNGYVYLQTHNSTWKLHKQSIPRVEHEAPNTLQLHVQDWKEPPSISCSPGRVSCATPPLPALLRNNPGIHCPELETQRDCPGSTARKHWGSHARSHPTSYWCKTQLQARQLQTKDYSAAIAHYNICMLQFFKGTFCF